MVDVRVGQRDGVDVRGIDGELVPVAEAEGLQALVESAVDEKAPPVALHQELRSGDGPGGAQALHGGDRRASGDDGPPSAMGRDADPAESTESLCRREVAVKRRAAGDRARP